MVSLIQRRHRRLAYIRNAQLLTVIIDIAVGIVPVLGDYLDYLFKANLRNLETLEVRPVLWTAQSDNL